MTRIVGVLRADTASDQITGVSPNLSMDEQGAIYAHVVSSVPVPSGLPTGDFITASVSVANVSTSIIAADTARTYFAIYNLGANPVFLQFGGAAALTDFPLVSGGFYEPLVVPTNEVFGIVAAGTEDVFVFSL